jgi:hypothetical protein
MAEGEQIGSAYVEIGADLTKLKADLAAAKQLIKEELGSASTLVLGGGPTPAGQRTSRRGQPQPPAAAVGQQPPPRNTGAQAVNLTFDASAVFAAVQREFDKPIALTFDIGDLAGQIRQAIGSLDLSGINLGSLSNAIGDVTEAAMERALAEGRPIVLGGTVAANAGSPVTQAGRLADLTRAQENYKRAIQASVVAQAKLAPRYQTLDEWFRSRIANRPVNDQSPFGGVARMMQEQQSRGITLAQARDLVPIFRTMVEVIKKEPGPSEYIFANPGSPLHEKLRRFGGNEQGFSIGGGEKGRAPSIATFTTFLNSLLTPELQVGGGLSEEAVRAELERYDTAPLRPSRSTGASRRHRQQGPFPEPFVATGTDLTITEQALRSIFGERAGGPGEFSGRIIDVHGFADAVKEFEEAAGAISPEFRSVFAKVANDFSKVSIAAGLGLSEDERLANVNKALDDFFAKLRYQASGIEEPRARMLESLRGQAVRPLEGGTARQMVRKQLEAFYADYTDFFQPGEITGKGGLIAQDMAALFRERTPGAQRGVSRAGEGPPRFSEFEDLTTGPETGYTGGYRDPARTGRNAARPLTEAPPLEAGEEAVLRERLAALEASSRGVPTAEERSIRQRLSSRAGRPAWNDPVRGELITQLNKLSSDEGMAAERQAYSDADDAARRATAARFGLTLSGTSTTRSPSEQRDFELTALTSGLKGIGQSTEGATYLARSSASRRATVEKRFTRPRLIEEQRINALIDERNKLVESAFKVIEFYAQGAENYGAVRRRLEEEMAKEEQAGQEADAKAKRARSAGGRERAESERGRRFLRWGTLKTATDILQSGYFRGRRLREAPEPLSAAGELARRRARGGFDTPVEAGEETTGIVSSEAGIPTPLPRRRGRRGAAARLYATRDSDRIPGTRRGHVPEDEEYDEAGVSIGGGGGGGGAAPPSGGPPEEPPDGRRRRRGRRSQRIRRLPSAVPWPRDFGYGPPISFSPREARLGAEQGGYGPGIRMGPREVISRQQREASTIQYVDIQQRSLERQRLREEREADRQRVGSISGLTSLRRQLGLGPQEAAGILRNEREQLNKLEAEDSKLAAVARNAERRITKRGFTASVTDILQNLAGGLDEQVAAVDRFNRERLQLRSSREARTKAITNYQLARQTERTAREALAQSGADVGSAERNRLEQQVRQARGVRSAAFEQAQIRRAAFREQTAITAEAQERLPTAAQALKNIGLAGLASTGAQTLGIVSGLAAFTAIQTAIQAISTAAAPAVDKLFGFAATLDRVSASLSEATRAAGGQAGVAIAGAAAPTGISAAGLAQIQGPLQQFTELRAGTDAFREMTDLVRASRAAGEFGTNVGRSIGGIQPWGIFGTPSITQQLAEGWLPAGAGSLDLRARQPGSRLPEAAQLTPKEIQELNFSLSILNKQMQDVGMTTVEWTDGIKDAGERQTQVAAAIDAMFNPELVKRIQSGIVGITEGGRAVTDPTRLNEIVMGLTRAGQPSAEVLLQQQEREIRAQEAARTSRRRLYIDQQLPFQTAIGVLQSQVTRGGPTAGLAFASKAERQSAIGDLGEIAGLYKTINIQTGQAIASASLFVTGKLGFKAGFEFTEALSAAVGYAQQIADIQIGIQTQQAAHAAHQYSYQIDIAKRSLSDALALSGKITGSTKNNLGAVERENFLLSQRLRYLQLEQAQRQINFKLAVAGFVVPGLTPEEQAARVTQAKVEAEYAQKQLDIQEKLAGLAEKGFAISASRSVQDLTRQLGLLQEGRALVIDTSLAEKKIAALNVLRDEQFAIAQKTYQDANDVADDMIQRMAEMEASGARFAASLAKTLAKIYGAYVNDIVAIFNQASARLSKTGYKSYYTPEGDRQITHGASGLIGDTIGQTELTVGEAGTEKVAVLKNPQTVPIGSLGGMMTPSGGGSAPPVIFNINIAIGDNSGVTEAQLDQWAHEIARRMGRELGTRVSLLGLRSAL